MSDRTARRRQRRVSFVGLALVALVVLTGCTLPPPAGPANLRYRDPIFTNVTEQDAIPYATAPDANGVTQTWGLDMYTPTGDTQTSRPAVVLVHGGGFVGGTSKDNPMRILASAFTQRGYVTVSINYPLLAAGHKCSSENPPSQTCIDAAFAAQHAAQAAIRFLRANAAIYGVDPNRVAVEGTSAGAVTALAVAVNSGDPGTDGNPGYSSYANAAMAISGELPHSFAYLDDPSDSAVLMLNGTADPVVSFTNAAQTASDLANAGVPIVFEPIQGAGHVPFGTNKTLLVDQSVFFAYYMLHLDQAAGQSPAAARALKAQEQAMARRYPGIAHALQRSGYSVAPRRPSSPGAR